MHNSACLCVHARLKFLCHIPCNPVSILSGYTYCGQQRWATIPGTKVLLGAMQTTCEWILCRIFLYIFGLFGLFTSWVIFRTDCFLIGFPGRGVLFLKMNFKIPASGLFRQLDFMGRSWRDMLARTTTPTFICQLRKGGCPRVHNLQLQFVCKTWSKRNPACPYITSPKCLWVCVRTLMSSHRAARAS